MKPIKHFIFALSCSWLFGLTVMAVEHEATLLPGEFVERPMFSYSSDVFFIDAPEDGRIQLFFKAKMVQVDFFILDEGGKKLISCSLMDLAQGDCVFDAGSGVKLLISEEMGTYGGYELGYKLVD